MKFMYLNIFCNLPKSFFVHFLFNKSVNGRHYSIHISKKVADYSEDTIFSETIFWLEAQLK